MVTQSCNPPIVSKTIWVVLRRLFLLNQTLDLNQFYYTERQSSNLVRVRKFPAWARPHYDIESEDHDAIDSKTLIYNK